MTSRHVIVSTQLGDDVVVAGTATFTQIGYRLSTTFRYDPDYLYDTDGAYAIDPGVPLSEGGFSGDQIPSAFLDASPDQWGRRLLETTGQIRRMEGGGPAALTEVDMLLGVSDFMRQGALRFQDTEDGEYLTRHTAVPKAIELDNLLSDVDEFLAEEPTNWAGATQNLLDAGGDTLGGMRAKAAVLDEEGIWLAKFPMPTDQVNVMVWEKTALDLAERAGIEVPARRLIDIGGRHVLRVNRFDRVGDRRVPYISGRTLMRVRPDDIRNFDYSQMAQALRLEGDQPRADLERLWRRVAFMVLINNTDDHLLNHGFLHDHTGWKMSPAFDLNPNADFGQARSGGVSRSFTPHGSMDAMMRFAVDCQMTSDRASEVLGEVVEATSAWREVAEANGATGKEIAKFSDSFDVLADQARARLGIAKRTESSYLFTAGTDREPTRSAQPRKKDTGTPGHPGQYDTIGKKEPGQSSGH